VRGFLNAQARKTFALGLGLFCVETLKIIGDKPIDKIGLLVYYAKTLVFL
jgi:hypothetical protein